MAPGDCLGPRSIGSSSRTWLLWACYGSCSAGRLRSYARSKSWLKRCLPPVRSASSFSVVVSIQTGPLYCPNVFTSAGSGSGTSTALTYNEIAERHWTRGSMKPARTSQELVGAVMGSELSTLKVGGPCGSFARARNASELDSVVKSDARALGRKPTVIGFGSNLLISDDGCRELLLQFKDDEANASIDPRSGLVKAPASMPWDRLVAQTVDAGLQGIECVSGVPGTVAGAVVQNAGAYGQELRQVLREVVVYDTGQFSFDVLKARNCRFGYRTSAFKSEKFSRRVVVEATFQLRPLAVSQIRYDDVARQLLMRHGIGPYPLAAIRQAVLDTRSSKGMLLGEDRNPSAGSFFVNPECSGLELYRHTRVNPRLREIPRTKVGYRTYRLSAAALIEASGFRRGFRSGSAGLSDQHALAIVNLGGACADDIVKLAKEIRSAVRSEFGLTLKPEVVTLGFGRKADPFKRS